MKNGDKKSSDSLTSIEYVQKQVSGRYDILKDKAWTGILGSTNVTSKLSSAAQKRVQSEFEQIKKLEFTVSSIYGFLCGIVNSQGDIQMQMACDIFDLITRYHSDNTVFFKGWVSNSNHRTCGMKIKTTRFILPNHKSESYHRDLPYESRQMLSDFDKVFAMLDGRAEADLGLDEMFSRNFDALRSGSRVDSSYFSCRYYPGAGTIHFFPKSKKLVDRLNLLVGRHRAWLPPTEARVADAFWLQFESAEKFDKEIRSELDKGMRGRSWYEHPLEQLARPDDDNRKAKAESDIDAAMSRVLERHGISVDFQLQDQDAPLMLKAA